MRLGYKHADSDIAEINNDFLSDDAVKIIQALEIGRAHV